MKNFLEKWGSQFKQVECILQYLRTYSQIHSDLNNKDLNASDELCKQREVWNRCYSGLITRHFIAPDKLYERQEEWLWLYSKLGDVDKKFFKPYWIPIGNSFDWCIDLSDEQLTISQIICQHYPSKQSDCEYWEKYASFCNGRTILMLSKENELALKQYQIDEMIVNYCKHVRCVGFSQEKLSIFISELFDTTKDQSSDDLPF